MSWWIWALAGIGLLAFEAVTPGGLFALFFGVGALLVAPLAAAGVTEVIQWLAFSALSLVGLVAFRGPLMRRLARRAADAPELVGEQATLTEDLPVGGEARAELRGTTWTARAASDVPLQRGQRCRVERVEGLTLWLRAE
jgi:membrane protein implicated in regulation of membrane protease activity